MIKGLGSDCISRAYSAILGKLGTALQQSVTSCLETSQYRDFSQFFESIGLGLKNFGLEKSLGIGLENI